MKNILSNFVVGFVFLVVIVFGITFGLRLGRLFYSVSVDAPTWALVLIFGGLFVVLSYAIGKVIRETYKRK